MVLGAQRHVACRLGFRAELGGTSTVALKGLAVQEQVLHVIQGFMHTAALEKQFQSLQILAENQKRCGAINAFGHACFELQQSFLVLAVEHTQFGIGLSFQIDVITWFEWLAGGVGFAVFAVLPIAGRGDCGCRDFDRPHRWFSHCRGGCDHLGWF